MPPPTRKSAPTIPQLAKIRRRAIGHSEQLVPLGHRPHHRQPCPPHRGLRQGAEDLDQSVRCCGVLRDRRLIVEHFGQSHRDRGQAGALLGGGGAVELGLHCGDDGSGRLGGYIGRRCGYSAESFRSVAALVLAVRQSACSATASTVVAPSTMRGICQCHKLLNFRPPKQPQPRQSPWRSAARDCDPHTGVGVPIVGAVEGVAPRPRSAVSVLGGQVSDHDAQRRQHRRPVAPLDANPCQVLGPV